jgi:hypothetical protein
MSVEMQSGNFLNEEQKKVKQKIMEELIGVMQKNLGEDDGMFNPQTSFDVMLAIVMMFTRDTLAGMFFNSNISQDKDTIKTMCSNLFTEVTRQIIIRMEHYKTEFTH